MDVSILLPAYREAENLVNILPKIKGVMDNTAYTYEILVLDTVEAMDNTEEITAVEGARHVRRRGGNLYGDAIKTGFADAEGRYSIVMDCDGSHDPAEIAPMLALAEEGADLVIGSRYIKGGHTDNNFILRLMSGCVNLAYRTLFGLKVKDVSDSFRVYHTAQVKPLKLECDNFDLVEEILIRLTIGNPGMKIKEHPISFNKRAHGESKRDLLKFVVSYISTIIRLMKIKASARRVQ